ncbi:DNA cytosine methyltransferase [Pantoea allii]|uniref:DNA cytosine methyltransferase n=1 Tax=Pantoea allii TaxID=574096 RepID=UPI001F4D766C|nr:DNA cytosine methyltransferase [Pantoea allii]MCH9297424.1 DNA cytosine methyltransferase [Pantoea allii]MDJ0036186.1 DNA cytosine methyltransferase [Pantoea allii]
MDKYKVIDLFSGAGGMSAGFEMAGFKISASIELMSKYAQTHALNFPNCHTLSEDITNISPAEFAELTGLSPRDSLVIIGGPPCQTFSSIGRSKIESIIKSDIKLDPRNYLFKNYFEYVSYFKPDFFVMENVPNLKTKYNGEIFKNILDICADLGYHINFSILDASHFGIPQKRKRLFIVGSRYGDDFEFPKETHKTNPTTVYDAIGDLPEIYDGIRAGALPYSKQSSLTSYQLLMRNANGLVGNNICRVSNLRAKEVFSYMKPGDKYMDLPEKIRKILPFKETRFQDRLKRLVMDEPSWTVLAHIGMDGYRYIHPIENRTLSVREAARIQSFPDHFEFVGNMREQYIQVGNSVPPLLAKCIAEQVKKLCQKK